MVAAIFEIDGWAGCERHFFKGETAAEVLTRLNYVQDLRCLARMSWGGGLTEEEGDAISYLWKLLDKQQQGTLTAEDLIPLDIHLGIGSLKCLGAGEGEKAVEKLREEYLQLS